MEIELKYRLTSADQGAAILVDPNCERPISAPPNEPEPQRLFSLYLDSHDHRLAQSHIALRLRSNNSKNERAFTLTCKYGSNVHGALHQRAEDEALLFDPTQFTALDPSQWPERITPLLSHLKAYPLVQRTLGDAELCELLRTVFERRTRLLRWNETYIELAVDQGDIIAGAHREPFLELELELKEGHVEDLLACGEYLRQQYDLAAEPLSKLERGQRLFNSLRSGE